MSRPLLYISRLLPAPVMTTAQERFTLVNEPRDVAPSWETVQAGLRAADAAICTLTDRIDAAMLADIAHLKVLANYAVGYNNIDLAAASRQGIVVTNTPDVLTESTADLAWALMLAVGDDTAKLWEVRPYDTVDYACEHVFRDFTEEERARYGIDDSPTCPQFAEDGQ